MTTAAIREEVKKYIDKADERSLRIIQADEAYDWWEDISDEAKASVKKGIKQAEEGKQTNHKDVVKKYKKWL